jgi:type I restriction enzyme S subunit
MKATQMRDGWVEYKFKDVATAVKGKLPKSKNEVGLGVPYLTANYLRSNKPDFWIDNLEGAVTAEDGDCLILWDGAGAGDLFSSRRGVVSSTMAVVTTESSRILREFLTLFMSSKADYIKETCRGTTVPHVSPDAIANMELKIPPLSEQIRIVDLISSVDVALRTYAEYLDSCQNLQKAITSKIFQNQSIAATKLGSYCSRNDIQIGPFGSQLHASDYLPEGIPVVMPQDIINGKISKVKIAHISADKANELSRHRLYAGDILFARRGDLTKRAIVSRNQEGWICGTGTVRVRTKILHPQILFHAVTTDEVNSWLLSNAVGATMPNLNTALVNDIPIRVPNNVKDQLIALEELDQNIIQRMILIERLKNVRSSLLEDLLNGNHEIPAKYDEVIGAA